jgi:hypothetical protein
MAESLTTDLALEFLDFGVLNVHMPISFPSPEKSTVTLTADVLLLPIVRVTDVDIDMSLRPVRLLTIWLRASKWPLFSVTVPEVPISILLS